MDEAMRMARAKTWILRTIVEVAKGMGLKLRAEWNMDEHSKDEDKFTQYSRYLVVLTYEDGGSDAGLSFDPEELCQYPGNTENLRRKIGIHLKEWQSDTEPHT